MKILRETGRLEKIHKKKREKHIMSKKNINRIAMFLLCLFTASMAACGMSGDSVSFKTEYQAVFLDNGQVFFGKLEKGGSAHPLLKEVYYIGRQASPDGKETVSILLKRGNEWHSPEYMYLTSSHIVMIEPVSPTSRVAELIKELNSKLPAKNQSK
jgi:hypothetical protein